jgi:hypothetical protein
MLAGEYICTRCYSLDLSQFFLPALSAAVPEEAPRGGCARCQFVDECRSRVMNNLWVLCEIPNELDLALRDALDEGER